MVPHKMPERREKKFERKAKIKARKQTFQLRKNTHKNKEEYIALDSIPNENEILELSQNEMLELITVIKNRIILKPESNIEEIKCLFFMMKGEYHQVICECLKIITEIIIDISPGSLINISHSEEEKAISLEIQKLRGFEKKLVKYYAALINSISTLLDANDFSELMIKVKIISFECLCKLLIELPEMNYSSIIGFKIVKKISYEIDEIQNLAVQKLTELFEIKNEKLFKLKMRIMKRIVLYIKNTVPKKLNCRIFEIIDPHILIPQSEIRSPSQSKIEELVKEIKLLKKDKNRLKEIQQKKELLKELRIASAIPNERRQMIKYNNYILVAYLTIFSHLSKIPQYPNLLCNFLLHFEKACRFYEEKILWDILSVLIEYLKSINQKERVNLLEILECCVNIIQLGNKTSDVDERSIVKVIYKFILSNVKFISSNKFQDIDLLISLLTKLLLDRKQLSNDVISSFIKVLAIISSESTNEKNIILILELIKKIFERYVIVRRLLDSEESDENIDVFNKEIQDPYISNGLQTNIIREFNLIRSTFSGKGNLCKLISSIFNLA